MSESDSDTETEFESKTEFMNAVREEGAILDGLEYFTEGEGSATTYKARNDQGEVEDVTKGEIEAVWEAVHGEDGDDSDEADEPEELHLGTFYYSQANWDDQHRETLEDLLDEAGWYIDGEVDSGGYRIKTVDQPD